MIRAQKEDTVKVRYTGRLEDGTIFDASPPDRPLNFIVGRREVIDGFDEAVADMYQGETRVFTLPPEKAYGAHEDAWVEEIDRAQIPSGIQLKVGRQLEITGQDGNRLLVMIAGLTDDTVTLDGNHPLAGKALTFEIELLEIKKPLPAPGKKVD